MLLKPTTVFCQKKPTTVEQKEIEPMAGVHIFSEWRIKNNFFFGHRKEEKNDYIFTQKKKKTKRTTI